MFESHWQLYNEVYGSVLVQLKKYTLIKNRVLNLFLSRIQFVWFINDWNCLEKSNHKFTL